MNKNLGSNHSSVCNRVTSFDFLESLSAFLVVTLHQVFLQGTIPASIATSFSSAAVPVFFMVHGALLLNRNYSAKKQFKKNIKILVQLLAWNTSYLFISVIAGLIEKESISLGLLYDVFLLGKDSGGISSGHLWFIYALLFCHLFYPIINSSRDGNGKINKRLLYYITIITFLFGIVCNQLSFLGEIIGNYYFGRGISFRFWSESIGVFGKYSNCICFFLLGWIIFDKKDAIKARRSAYIRYSLLMIIGGLFFALLDRFMAYGSMNYNWKPLPNQYQHICTFLIAVGLFCFIVAIWEKEQTGHSAILAKVNRITAFVSTRSLDIYFIHAILARFIYVYLYSNSICSVFTNYVRAFIIVVISLLIGMIIRKTPIVRYLL